MSKILTPVAQLLVTGVGTLPKRGVYKNSADEELGRI